MFQQIESLVPSPHFFFFQAEVKLRKDSHAKTGCEEEGWSELISPTEWGFCSSNQSRKRRADCGAEKLQPTEGTTAPLGGFILKERPHSWFRAHLP